MLCALAIAGGLGCKKSGTLETPAEARAELATAAPEVDLFAGFPLHGIVEGTVITIRKDADPDSIPLGWLRKGELVRLKASTDKSATCKSGWHPLYPRGFVCAGEGILVSDTAPQVTADDRAQANRNAPFPYAYYLVKDAYVPEYHQVPSRDQQRVVSEYVALWQQLVRDNDAKKLEKFLAGTLPGQPLKPAVVRRFLDRGFYVASTGTTVRSQRKFARTVRGSFVKEQQLEATASAQFSGIELSAERPLPVAWAIRGATPQRQKTRSDGSTQLIDATDVPAIPRLTALSTWKRWARIEGQIMHELGDGTYLRSWYVAVAEALPRPKEVRTDEPWVHVDLSSQTLVLYLGDTPKYATLVSTGIDEHQTPTGSFRIQRKYVSDTMSDIGADAADDRYSIDDVPWTQYFDGSRALHGAFWHTHFGIKRSHGCVNLAPKDAFYVFQHTLPELPPAWHGISTQKTGEKGSLIIVTD